jgi:tyrosine-protein kinase Etk/Wzc
MSADNGQERINTPEGLTSGISIKEILLKHLHYWWLFLIVGILCVGIAWLYLRYTAPQYSVTATLLIRNDNMNRGGSGNGEDMFADIALFQSNTNKQNEIEILRSRTMMERVVKELGLQDIYYAVGNVKKPNIYNESPFEVEVLKVPSEYPNFTFNLHYKTEKSFTINEEPKEYFFGQIINLPFAQFKIHQRESVYSSLVYKDYIFQHLDVQVAAESFLKGLEVVPANDLSNVLRLTYVTDNPRLGADIVNQLTQEYSEAGIQDKNEINRKIIAFIDDRLDLVETQLDSVELNLQSFKTNKQVIDLEKQSEFYFGNMTDLDQNIRAQEIQLQVVRLLNNYLENPANKNSLVPSTLGLQDPTLQEQVGRYNQLLATRQRLVETGVTAQNPLMVSAESEIETARNNMVVNLNNIERALNNTLQSLSRKRASVEGEISSIPAKERESREKARQQEIKQNLYLYLLQKKEESEIAQASTIANSRVIDNALPKLDQVSPVPLRIYGIGLIAALVLPIIFIYLIDLFNDKVTRRSDITRITNAPIVAEIGHNDSHNILLFT